jgi:hypothetical protein
MKRYLFYLLAPLGFPACVCLPLPQLALPEKPGETAITVGGGIFSGGNAGVLHALDSQTVLGGGLSLRTSDHSSGIGAQATVGRYSRSGRQTWLLSYNTGRFHVLRWEIFDGSRSDRIDGWYHHPTLAFHWRGQRQGGGILRVGTAWGQASYYNPDPFSQPSKVKEHFRMPFTFEFLYYAELRRLQRTRLFWALSLGVPANAGASPSTAFILQPATMGIAVPLRF